MCYPFSDDDVPFDRDDAMQVAARLGKGDIVRLVRERGANNLLLPLLEAAKAGNLALVDYLLGEGAGTHGTDGSMFTPLGWAVSNGHDAIAHRLVREGAKFARQHDLDHAVKEARKGGHKALALQAIAWHRAV
jgi:ankyrin repeat protein